MFSLPLERPGSGFPSNRMPRSGVNVSRRTPIGGMSGMTVSGAGAVGDAVFVPGGASPPIAGARPTPARTPAAPQRPLTRRVVGSRGEVRAPQQALVALRDDEAHVVEPAARILPRGVDEGVVVAVMEAVAEAEGRGVGALGSGPQRACDVDSVDV